MADRVGEKDEAGTYILLSCLYLHAVGKVDELGALLGELLDVVARGGVVRQPQHPALSGQEEQAPRCWRGNGNCGTRRKKRR